MTTYTPTIGLEIHAELKTKSKMFCGCKNAPHGGEPNAHTCPVCLAHPGTLPLVNKDAVQKVLLVGTALNAQLATYSEFDRKNYFYPDIPKAYQISQYLYPFVSGGELSGVEITRIHLEEDTARSAHDKGAGSIVDFNRAGVPLMELVTEPVIHDSKTAGNFAKELQLLLRTLGVSDANMEKGEMRVEANVSVSSTDKMAKKYVEVKNINSFKAVEQAIEFEIKRQTKIYEDGGEIKQETRGWDENKGSTFSQRSKESADEYRYFPDPDIPKFDLEKVPEFDSSRLKEILPTLPSEIRLSLASQGVPDEQIETLLAQSELLKFFIEAVKNSKDNPKVIKITANYLTSDIVGFMQNNPDSVLDIRNATQFSELVTMIVDGKITSRVAKDLIKEVVFDGASPEKVAEEKGLLQNNSEDDLIPVIQKIIEENPVPVAEYKGGKESTLQFFVGLGMKATRGSANPGVLIKLFKEHI